MDKWCNLLVSGLIGCVLTIPSAFGFEGFLEPYETVDIASSETGVLVKIEVKEGDRVKRSDVLAVLDYRLIDASLSVAKVRKNSKSSLLSAQAEWKMANQKRTQFEKLHAAGNARKDEVAQAQLEENLASAQITRAKEQISIAGLEYKRIQAEIEARHIRSPIDGEVTTINRDPGELVSASQGPFMRVVNIDKLKFISNLPQSESSKIKEGDTVKIALDDSDTPLTAVVDYLSEIIDPTSGTTKVTLIVDQPGTAKSGAAGRITFE